MQEIKKKNVKNIGSYISKNYFHLLTNNFQDNFPNLTNTVLIPSDLIHQTLQLSKEITGIRFMYGLKDPLNPNSINIFLVPCINTYHNLESWSPLVSKQGYYNHEGIFHQITEVAEMAHNFVSYFAEGVGATYKEANRGIYFGINSLLDVTNVPKCTLIKVHLGVKGNTMPAVLQPLDSLENSIDDIYMDHGSLDPDDWDRMLDPDPCAVTLAVENLSIETELDIYRAFRDSSMKDYLYGGMLYEMYYFISPFVTAIIDQHADKKALLTDLYDNGITPFRILVQNGEEQEALFLLKRVLDDLVQTYHVTYALA